ncbi:hypothetical protein AZE42_09862 [Rhizopogon vesiculosus]|uniref:Uncharacterized protein n=1 Tax=Rhizopogon vesiculosus TaxID=180088 RepID=A0A1J8Q5I3_9AGAM|nr:hypothetical protein AZE42_09862 [Rhizopogon vesiculosus]
MNIARWWQTHLSGSANGMEQVKGRILGTSDTCRAVIHNTILVTITMYSIILCISLVVSAVLHHPLVNTGIIIPDPQSDPSFRTPKSLLP